MTDRPLLTINEIKAVVCEYHSRETLNEVLTDAVRHIERLQNANNKNERSEPMRGVKWHSDQWWNLMQYDYCVVDSFAVIWNCGRRPVLASGRWEAYGTSVRIGGIVVTDLPTDYRESLIERPKPAWHWPEPDESTPVDAKCWVRRFAGDEWLRRYHAKTGCCWVDGETSWSSGGLTSVWSDIVLADPNNPNAVPPQDFVPGKVGDA